MSEFICPKCGKVEPKEIYDSFPAYATCPKCNASIKSNGVFKIMSNDDAVRKRPSFYQKYLEENCQCPYCNSRNIKLITGKNEDGKSQFDRVVCNACGVTGPWFDGHPSDAIKGWELISNAGYLRRNIKDFIYKNKISCEEDIPQCDFIQEQILEFSEELCKIAGYWKEGEPIP